MNAIIIGGAGHVGLPLGIMLADAGIQTCLSDMNQVALDRIFSKEMPFIEYGADVRLWRTIKNGFLTRGAADLSDVSKYEFVIVCIGTPVDSYMNPKLGEMTNMIDRLANHMAFGQTLVIRSTVFPTTTDKITDRLKGLGIDVVYAPERITQGYAIKELPKLPQIIASQNIYGFTRVAKLFQASFPDILIIRLGTIEAELLKLFTNAHRYIQFALSNEFYRIATRIGANYDSIREGMMTEYPRVGNLPRAGFAAGPCLLKDTMQLVTLSPDFALGLAAEMANEHFPDFLVTMLPDVRGKTIGLLGMAFKSNIDDVRDSLSFKMKKLLEFYGAKVLCSDEFHSNPEFVSKEEVIANSSIVIVCVPHDGYKRLTFKKGQTVIDTWGIIGQNA